MATRLLGRQRGRTAGGGAGASSRDAVAMCGGWLLGEAELRRYQCQSATPARRGMQSSNFLLIIAYMSIYIYLLISQVVNSLFFFSFLVKKRSFLRSTDAFNDHSSRYTYGFMLSDYFPFSPFDIYYLLRKLLKCMCVPHVSIK
jgi:hypothetical protein